jgi:hypothetical protein
MVGRQLSVGKPILAHPTDSTVLSVLEMSPDVLLEILDGDLGIGPPVYAGDLAGLASKPVPFAVLDDRSKISVDPCAASKTIAHETRLGDDFDEMGERRELLDEVLHRICQSQLSLEQGRLSTGVRDAMETNTFMNNLIGIWIRYTHDSWLELGTGLGVVSLLDKDT